MAYVTQTQLLLDVVATIYDNTEELIEAQKHQDLLKDIVDSFQGSKLLLDDAAALRAITVYANGLSALLIDQNTAYVYDTTEATADDGYTYIKPTAVTGAGRWVLKTRFADANYIPATNTPAAAIQTIDWSLGNIQILDLGSATGNVTLTYTNPVTGGTYYLKVIQGAVARTLVYPGTAKWNGGTALIPTTVNDAIDLITMFYDGTNYFASYTTNYS